MPFAFDWQGVPVHGALDLLIEGARGWRVVDFKTDSFRGRTPAEAAEPYRVQLVLYGLAVERALGARPELAIQYLSEDVLHALNWNEVLEALTDARSAVDRGAALLPAAIEAA